MFFRLFLLFTIVPIIELYILIKVGSMIGPLPTVAYVVFTALIGTYIIRLQGFYVLYRIKEQVRQGKFPGDALIDGFLLVVAGALLVTPGLLTDFAGFLILAPVTRLYIKVWLRKKLLDFILRRR